MPDSITILLTTIFVNNFVMVQFLGLCPFMGASNRLDSAFGIAAATLFVMTLASSLSYLLNAWFLVPLEVEFLRIILFIVVIAAVVQFAEIVMRAMEPRLHQQLGVYYQLCSTGSRAPEHQTRDFNDRGVVLWSGYGSRFRSSADPVCCNA